MKIVKPGMHVGVLEGTRFFHARVTAVASQASITVEYGGVVSPASRMAGDPLWQINRFVGGT